MELGLPSAEPRAGHNDPCGCFQLRLILWKGLCALCSQGREELDNAPSPQSVACERAGLTLRILHYFNLLLVSGTEFEALPFLVLVLLALISFNSCFMWRTEKQTLTQSWNSSKKCSLILQIRSVCAAVCGSDCQMELPRLPARWASWGIHHTVSHQTDWDSPSLDFPPLSSPPLACI